MPVSEPESRIADVLLSAVRQAATLGGADARPTGPAGRRPPHAHGIDVGGRFHPTAAARRRYAGDLFDGDPVPVWGRFSATIGGAVGAADRLNNVGLALWVDPDGTHRPDRADGSPPGCLVAVNLGLFPTADPTLFPAFLQASHLAGEPRADGEPDPLSAFAAANPGVVAGILLYGRARQRGLPTGYAEATYHGNHGFWFTRRRGRPELVRYRWEPAAGDRTRRAPDADDRAPGDWSADSAALAEELVVRLERHGSARFTLVLEVGGPSQAPGDPSKSWPETLERFVAGELVVDTCLGRCFEQALAMPWKPPTGIATAGDDRVMQARAAVYPLARRT